MSIYETTNKIKSSKWNAFLLKEDELEEYLADGINTPTGGLFSRFSKENRENNERRNSRMVELLNLRKCQISEDYFKKNVVKPDKKIISMVIEPTKNIFNRGVSSVFKKTIKADDPLNIKLQELITEGKKESGDMVAFYPVSVIQNKMEKNGVLFITTNGICFVATNADLTTTILPYAAVSAVGPAFGAIAAGVSAIAAKYIAHSAVDYNMNKEQKKIIELAYKYSPCLIAKCFEGCQFIPYNIINALIYGKNTKENNFLLRCIYENVNKGVGFEVIHKVMIEIIEKLSGDNPPVVS